MKPMFSAWRSLVPRLVAVALFCVPSAVFAHVTAWGYNNHGQITVPADLTNVTKVSAGFAHTIALKVDGTVIAWGWNNFGQCDVPAGLTGVTMISAGYNHNLVRKSDGTVVAWGLNTSGECDVPADLTNVVAVSAGDGFSMALKGDGTVVVWGSNTFGQQTIPAGLSTAKSIAAGYDHCLAALADGTVVAWGGNAHGQRDVPAGLVNVIAVSGGSGHSLALLSTGGVVAWGWNTQGQCDVPADLTNAIAIDAGGEFSLAVKSDFTTVAWGRNNRNQLNIPAGTTGVTSVAGGDEHSVAISALLAVRNSYTAKYETLLTVNATSGVATNDVNAVGANTVVVNTTAHGLLALATDGSFTYMPEPDFLGVDTFSYRLEMGTEWSNTVLVGINVTKAYTLNPLALNPSTVIGGRGTRGTVSITGMAAPAAGWGCDLTYEPGAYGPALVTIAEGHKNWTFQITTDPVDTSITSLITATMAGQVRTATLTINPAALVKLTIAPTPVVGGTASHLWVYLDGKAGPSGTTVNLWSDTPGLVTIDPTVTIPAGSTYKWVLIKTMAVGTPTVVTFSAQIGSGPIKTATLTLNPPPG